MILLVGGSIPEYEFKAEVNTGKSIQPRRKTPIKKRTILGNPLVPLKSRTDQKWI
jgi:hypothetical protein